MTIPPLMILAIGILTVIGMIIFLRINAFIALITAAIVVSLMAPGSPAEKISRVATEFGSYAGKIGIVIALAAVIGKCMMDSGAADRIVRAFLRVLGEKRAPIALMGSGFVLSVPVFFDTVFYLLVPLSRSLYRRTGKNYLMYLLAIAAGGAITHTLVPPTPGPLVMAANLNINVGTMILVGALVGLPGAIIGVFASKVLDKMLDIPMRQIGSEPDPEPLSDEELPSLTMALLPVILPVIMISANTVLDTLADNEHTPRLTVESVTDWSQFQSRIAAAGQQPASPLTTDASGRAIAHMVTLLDPETAAVLTSATPVNEEQKQSVVDALNQQVLLSSKFYDPEPFDSMLPSAGQVKLRLKETDSLTDDQNRILNETAQLWSMLGSSGPANMRKVDLERFNRTLLEVLFPASIAPHEWNTDLRQAAGYSSLFGNANFALLISTAVSLWMLWATRKPTLVQMGQVVENSLMSGGAIILITAGGGAFGAMLKVAEIGPAIEGLFGGASGEGMFYLFLGFGIAAVLKVAQGSGTTAMIVASGMVASSINPESLGFHPVYLATAIGAGSLCGSWMNDSGFWIFAKMGGLTEAEGLKTWTPLLTVLGLVSFGVTLLLATVMPLTS